MVIYVTILEMCITIKYALSTILDKLKKSLTDMVRIYCASPLINLSEMWKFVQCFVNWKILRPWAWALNVCSLSLSLLIYKIKWTEYQSSPCGLTLLCLFPVTMHSLSSNLQLYSVSVQDCSVFRELYWRRANFLTQTALISSAQWKVLFFKAHSLHDRCRPASSKSLLLM